MMRNIGKWFDLWTGERTARWLGGGDIRGYQPPKGWSSEAHLIENHPITGKRFSHSQWWIFIKRNTRLKTVDTNN
jgi:hypothetical protein